MSQKFICTVFVLLSFSFLTCSMRGPAPELFEKGVQLAKEGKPRKAFKAFRYAAKKAPDSARYHFAAAQTAPDQNTAFMYSKFAWEKGFRNLRVFYTLLKLSFHTDKNQKLAYALELFSQLPDSVATPTLKGSIFSQFGHSDSALVVWKAEFEKNRNSSLIPKIAEALARTKKSEEAIDFLYQAKNDKILDGDGFNLLASLLAMRYQFDEVDRLFQELSKSNLYNDKFRLDYASFLVFNGRCDEALPLLQKPAGPESASVKALLNLRFTTLELYCALRTKDKRAFKKQINNPPSDSLLNKKTTTLFAAIQSFADKDTNAYSLLLKARKQLPPDPVTTILNARAALGLKKYKEAAALYQQLPKVIAWAPQTVSERAQTFALIGKDDEALGILSIMHKNRIFTRQSLELFRNLTLKKDLLEKSQAAQKLLEQKYSNDVGLKWKGLLLAIRSQNLDTALIIAQQLSSAYPDDERFATTRFSLLLMKKEYKKVLNLLPESNISSIKHKTLKAAALKGLGDTTKAITEYEDAIKEKKDSGIMFQLAELYYAKKNFKKAAGLYEKLIKEKSELKTAGDSTRLAILLNNQAYTLLTSGEDNLSAALDMAKRAYAMLPENMNIFDTYIAVLMEKGEYKKCISLISGSKNALKEKRLVCYLAEAWQKTGDRNKAKRYLEDALKIKDDEQKLTPRLTDAQIKELIRQLSEEK